MKIEEAIIMVRLRSEAEAASLGLPNQAGLDVYDGIIDDDANNWSDEQFVNWCKSIEAKYDVEWEDWKLLYRQISKIMGEYAKFINSAKQSN